MVEENQDRGLLDISVELSMRDIMAGHEFALFALVKNPFTKPIWIRRVHVSLPSELKLAINEKAKEELKKATRQQEALNKKNDEIRRKTDEKFLSLQKQVTLLGKKLNGSGTDTSTIKSSIEELISEIKDLPNEMQKASSRLSNVHITDADVGKVKIGSNIVNIHVMDRSKINEIEIVESSYEQQAHMRTVELESSLPENVALQLGNTAVYTLLLNVKSNLLFRPSRYRLQFNVNYSFVPAPKDSSEEKTRDENAEEKLFINTFAHELSIRTSIYSIIVGSAIGGSLGSLARIIQITHNLMPAVIVSSTFSIIVAIILSGMAIIFIARKSDAQSFVSVEDFWGGVLIGFLVGYSGTTFFESLTGISSPTK